MGRLWGKLFNLHYVYLLLSQHIRAQFHRMQITEENGTNEMRAKWQCGSVFAPEGMVT